MKSRRVLVSAAAEAQLAHVRSWWREHREAALDLFDRELDAAMFAICSAPAAFPVYRREGDADVRRVLLPRSHYAVYFVLDRDDLVLVVAVWHVARGAAPPLP